MDLIFYPYKIQNYQFKLTVAMRRSRSAFFFTLRSIVSVSSLARAKQQKYRSLQVML